MVAKLIMRHSTCQNKAGVVQRYSTCSRENCACHSGRRHGPRLNPFFLTVDAFSRATFPESPFLGSITAKAYSFSAFLLDSPDYPA